MKFLYNPIRKMTVQELDDVLITQLFGNDPVASRDTWYGNKLVRKGEHVYMVLAGQRGHNGIDVMAQRGRPIYQPADCPTWVIEQDDKATGLGRRVSLRHEAGGRFFMSTYGHMDRFAGGPNKAYAWNDKSRPAALSDAIGYVDSTGYSTGDHLHWSVYEVDAQGRKLAPANGFGGAVDPFLFSHKADIPTNPNEMRLVNDNGTYFLVGDKGKVGIADPTALGILKSVTSEEDSGSTAGIAEVATFERSSASLTAR